MAARDLLHAVADKISSFANMIPSFASPTPSVYLTTPPPATYQIWSNEPEVLLPPRVDTRTFSRPFNIDPSLYNNALHVSVPITVALAYATTVYLINQYNAKRKYKPWAISKTLFFFTFVLVHNMVLAVYSAWTFTGMLNAVRRSWPGVSSRSDLPHVVDALCKMHGPRGFGSAATWSPADHSWSYVDNMTQLLGGEPDSSDVGRMWNEGLGYYGWIFYISKFYEVVDSLIIMAKGKKTGFLQTYHHAGAMMAMWAGIRYMSPPIWMFTFINSGLHTLMYTYYTAAALSFRVPAWMKRTLTTLQIIQIVFGSSYAFAHLWIAYDMPAQVPYIFSHNVFKAISSFSSTLPSATSSVHSVISSATASAGIGNILKKVALRAGGHEGLAENVRNEQGEVFGIDAVHSSQIEEAQEEMRYKLEYQKVHCLDSSGEVAAIMLNLLYLLPLTWLFIKFFVDNYINRQKHQPPPAPSRIEITTASGKDAAKSLEAKVKEAMDDENSGREVNRPKEMHMQIDELKATTEDIASKAREAVRNIVKTTKEKAKAAATTAKEKEEEILHKAMSASRESTGGFEKVEHEDAEPDKRETEGETEGDSKAAPNGENHEVEAKGKPVKVNQEESNGDNSPRAPDDAAAPDVDQGEIKREPADDTASSESQQKDKDAEAMPPPTTNGVSQKSSSRPPPASRTSSIPTPTSKKGDNKSRSTSRKPMSKSGAPAHDHAEKIDGDVPPVKDETQNEDARAGQNDNSQQDSDVSTTTDVRNGEENGVKEGKGKEEEAKGLEVNPDEMLDNKEKDAQGEMQP